MKEVSWVFFYGIFDSVVDHSPEMNEGYPPKPSGVIGTRHIQIFMFFVGLIMCFMQRVNMAVGIVAMSDSTANPHFPTIPYTTAQKGVISGIFYWGYISSGIPAGYLADKYGPVRIVSISGGVICGILTIAVPFVAINWSYEALCAIRVLQGVGQGAFYPSTQAFLSKWAIPDEREKFAWVWSGCSVGTIVMMLLGGVIAASPGGWPTIFYSSGALSIAWGILFLIYGADSPARHRTISKEEKNYIELNFLASAKKGKDMRVPYRSIITSIPVWVLLIVMSAENWGFALFITLMPTYLKGVYGFDITENGLVSALPYITMFLCIQLFSYLGGHLRNFTSVNFTRKFWSSVALYGTALAILVLAAFDIGSTEAVVILMIANGMSGAMYLGFLSNHLDLAPNYAGFLLGISNALGNIVSIIAPIWAGYIITDEHNMSQWQQVFFVAAIVAIVGNTIFLIFGSTKLQRWNDPDSFLNESDTRASSSSTSAADDTFTSIKGNQ